MIHDKEKVSKVEATRCHPDSIPIEMEIWHNAACSPCGNPSGGPTQFHSRRLGTSLMQAEQVAKHIQKAISRAGNRGRRR